MYSEKSYTNHILALKIKRIFLIITFSIIGCALGIFIGFYLVDILLFDQVLKQIIIAVSTIIFFILSILFTSNIQKEILDSYWKIAVLRKLTLISKKLNNLNNLDSINPMLNDLNIIENTDNLVLEEKTLNSTEENSNISSDSIEDPKLSENLAESENNSKKDSDAESNKELNFENNEEVSNDINKDENDTNELTDKKDNEISKQSSKSKKSKKSKKFKKFKNK